MHSRYLITGGLGYIGSALTLGLLATNPSAEILLFDLDVLGRRHLFQRLDRCSIYNADIRNAAAIEHALEKFEPDCIFHLAAIHFIPDCDRSPADTYAVNAGGTRLIIEAVNRRQLVPPRAFILASSAAVYSPNGERACSEGSPTSPTGVYGKSKLLAEDATRKLTSCAFSICRFFNVYGYIDPNPHLVPVLCKQFASGAVSIKIGNLTPVRDYIHIADIVSALIAVETSTEKLSGGVYNVSTGMGTSVQDVVDALEAASGRHVALRHVDELRRSAETSHLVGSSALLQTRLAWQPLVPFDRGIRSTLFEEATAVRAFH